MMTEIGIIGAGTMRQGKKKEKRATKTKMGGTTGVKMIRTGGWRGKIGAITTRIGEIS